MFTFGKGKTLADRLIEQDKKILDLQKDVDILNANIERKTLLIDELLRFLKLDVEVTSYQKEEQIACNFYKKVWAVKYHIKKNDLPRKRKR